VALFRKRRPPEEVERRPMPEERPEILPLAPPQRLEAVAEPHKEFKPPGEEELAKPWIESETEMFKRFWAWLWQAKATMWLIIATIISFGVQIIYLAQLPEELVEPTLNFVSNNPFANVILSPFVHGSPAHLIGNMIGLLVFGRIVERKFGNAKLLLLYFGAGALSSLVSLAFGEGGIGASGALSGIVAVAMLMYPFTLTYIIGGLPLPITLVGWFFIANDVFGILFPRPESHIGNIAHLGGTVSIFLLLYLILKKNYGHIVTRGILLNLPFGLLIFGLIFLGGFGVVRGLFAIISIVTLSILFYKWGRKPKEKISRIAAPSARAP